MSDPQSVQTLYKKGKLIEAYETFLHMNSNQENICPTFVSKLRNEYRQYETLKNEIQTKNSLQYVDYNGHDLVPEVYSDLNIRYRKTIENAFTLFTVKSQTAWPILASIVFSVTGLLSLIPTANVSPRVLERTDNYAIVMFEFPGQMVAGNMSKSYKIICKMQIISDHRPLDKNNLPAQTFSGFLISDQSSDAEYQSEFCKCEGTPIKNFSILVTAKKDVCPSLITFCMQRRIKSDMGMMQTLLQPIKNALLRRQLWYLVDGWLRRGILLYHKSRCTSALSSMIRAEIDQDFIQKWFALS